MNLRHAASPEFAGMTRPPESPIGLSAPGACRTGWQWLFDIRTAQSPESLWTNAETAPRSTRRTRKMARMEAVLFIADGSITHRKLAHLATLADVAEARELAARLNQAYDEVGCAFRIEDVAGGLRLMSRPRFSLWLGRLHNRQARVKLSPPMMETLSIVAYRQPITRAEVEQIRGVQSSEMLKQLMERGHLRITGEEDSLGRPFLYGTTRQFLEEFGLGNLDDLPMSESLRRQDEPDEDEEELEEVVDEPESTDDDAREVESTEEDIVNESEVDEDEIDDDGDGESEHSDAA